MDTQTVFSECGVITIYPCDYELGNHILVDGGRASMKGRMVTEDDGTSRFTPYAEGTGSRYKVHYHTKYAEVKESKHQLFFTVSLPKHWTMMQQLSQLVVEVMAFSDFMNQYKNKRK